MLGKLRKIVYLLIFIKTQNRYLLIKLARNFTAGFLTYNINQTNYRYFIYKRKELPKNHY